MKNGWQDKEARRGLRILNRWQYSPKRIYEDGGLCILNQR